MKIPSIVSSAKIACAASLLCLTFGASAATTWTVADFRDTATSTATAKSISALSSAGNANTFTTACLQSFGTAGWGIVNTSEKDPCTSDPGTGPHAADNDLGVDLFFIAFDSKVNLTQVNIGWNGTDNAVGGSIKDSDISVLAYTGNSLTTPSITGLTTSNLESSGWKVVGNYADVGALSGNKTTTPTSISSSWWLISAYSSKFGTGTKLDDGNDYFKLLSVAGNIDTKTNETPEPGSLALAALGLLGIVGLRRRAVGR